MGASTPSRHKSKKIKKSTTKNIILISEEKIHFCKRSHIVVCNNDEKLTLDLNF